MLKIKTSKFGVEKFEVNWTVNYEKCLKLSKNFKSIEQLIMKNGAVKSYDYIRIQNLRRLFEQLNHTII